MIQEQFFFCPVKSGWLIDKEQQLISHFFFFKRDCLYLYIFRNGFQSFLDVLGGYNGTIFAYGQTSSGKTHTMEVSSIELCLLHYEYKHSKVFQKSLFKGDLFFFTYVILFFFFLHRVSLAMTRCRESFHGLYRTSSLTSTEWKKTWSSTSK